MTKITEFVVEEAALGWLESLGYVVLHGSAISPCEPGAERSDPGHPSVVLARRLGYVLQPRLTSGESQVVRAGNLLEKVS